MAAAAPAAEAALPRPPLAIGRDGRWRIDAAVAGEAPDCAAPHCVLLTELRPGGERRALVAAALDGSDASAPTAASYTDARRSFALVFERLPELWEVSLDPAAPPVFDAWVHDWRSREGVARPGFLHPRRMPLADPVRGLASGTLGPWLLVQLAREPQPGCLRLAWIHLDARRIVATLDLRSAALPPHPLASLRWLDGRGAELEAGDDRVFVALPGGFGGDGVHRVPAAARCR